MQKQNLKTLFPYYSETELNKIITFLETYNINNDK